MGNRQNDPVSLFLLRLWHCHKLSRGRGGGGPWPCWRHCDGNLSGEDPRDAGDHHYAKTKANHRWHRRPSWGRNHDDSCPTHRRGETWSPPNPVLPVLPLRGHHDHHGRPHHHQVWRSPWRWASWVFQQRRNDDQHSGPSYHHYQVWWTSWRGPPRLPKWGGDNNDNNDRGADNNHNQVRRSLGRRTSLLDLYLL